MPLTELELAIALGDESAGKQKQLAAVEHTNGFGKPNIRALLAGRKDVWKSYSSALPTKKKKIIICDPYLNAHAKTALELEFYQALISNGYEVVFWQQGINPTNAEPCKDIADFWQKMLTMQPATRKDVAKTLDEHGISANDYIILDYIGYAAVLEKLSKSTKMDAGLWHSGKLLLNEKLTDAEIAAIDPQSVTELENYACYQFDSSTYPNLTTLTMFVLNGALDLKTFPKLESLVLANANDVIFPHKLKSLILLKCKFAGVFDLTNCTDLNVLSIEGCDIADYKLPTRLERLYFGKLLTITTLNFIDFANLSTLNLDGCSKLISLQVPANLTILHIKDCAALTRLDLSECKTLQSIVIEDCLNLIELKLPASIDKSIVKIKGCPKLPASVGLSEHATILLELLHELQQDFEGLGKIAIYNTIETLIKSDRSDILAPVSEILKDFSAGLNRSQTSSLKPINKIEINACNDSKLADFSSQITELVLNDCAALTDLELPPYLESLSINNCANLQALNLRDRCNPKQF